MISFGVIIRQCRNVWLLLIKSTYNFVHAEKMATYNVYVSTSDTKGAGTDANVYIVIYGENGDTGKFKEIIRLMQDEILNVNIF